MKHRFGCSPVPRRGPRDTHDCVKALKPDTVRKGVTVEHTTVAEQLYSAEGTRLPEIIYLPKAEPPKRT